MLCALATVKQPDLGTLGQAQCNGRDIARSRGYAGTRTKKSDLQGVEEWRFVPYPVTGQQRNLQSVASVRQLRICGVE